MHNVGNQNMGTLINLTKQAFDSIANENWAAICAHVRKVEEDYKLKEPLLDDTLDRLIITVNTGSSDEEGESEDDLLGPESDVSDVDLGVTPL